jgi:uncharacterized protein
VALPTLVLGPATESRLLETPCVNICLLDEDLELCVGCGRNMDEIAQWADMTPAKRRAIMAALPERMKHLEAKGSHA